MEPSCSISLTFGINGSLRKREVQGVVPHTEHYLFNSQANLIAYSNNLTEFAYYGYNAANTRSYKLSMLNQNQWVNGQPFPLHFSFGEVFLRSAKSKQACIPLSLSENVLCSPKESLRQASKKELVHFFEREQTSPKVTEAKERAFRGGEKKPVHYARQLAERRNRRCGRMQSQACLGYAEPRGEKDAKHLNSQHRSTPLPCYGKRIFSVTPQVAFATLQPTIATTDIFYYHTNHLGSTSFVTDQNQTVTQGFLYAPFGEITTEYAPLWQNATLPKYAFNAKKLDEETGMYYYEARYYKPPVFTSRDPMFEKKPWLNPYHYCSNNPVGRIDPSGMSDEEAPTTKKPYKIENSKQKSPYSQSNNNTKTSTTATPKTPQRGSTPATPKQGTPQPAPNQPSNGSSTWGFGWGFSLDVNIAVGAIGYSFEVGFVQDASGNTGAFYSHGPSAGFEASIGFNGFLIPNSDFKLNVFEGQSMSINANWSFFSGGLFTDNSRGAEKDYYFNNYGGAKVGVGLGVGASITHTKTYLISIPNVGRLEKIYDSVYFRTGGMR